MVGPIPVSRIQLTPSLAYFVSLGLGHEEASDLHLKYYTQYGLALRGLTRHHDVGIVTQGSKDPPQMLKNYPGQIH
jgi:hypothetical protein